MVVLGCTHYPLLLDELLNAAPWPVLFIDPAPAIARRVSDLLRTLSVPTAVDGPADGTVFFTSPRGRSPKSLAAYCSMGFARPDVIHLPV